VFVYILPFNLIESENVIEIGYKSMIRDALSNASRQHIAPQRHWNCYSVSPPPVLHRGNSRRRELAISLAKATKSAKTSTRRRKAEQHKQIISTVLLVSKAYP